MEHLRKNRTGSLATDPQSTTATVALTMLLVLAVLATPSVQAQTFTVLHTFTGGQDGAYPDGGLTIDGAGNFYGTTFGGPPSGDPYGTVYKLTHRGPSWVVSPLYSFQGGSDGQYPRAKPVLGPDGTLYGVTLDGGDAGCGEGDGCGTVYNLRPAASACKSALCPWTETVLHRFTGSADGASPLYVTLIFDAAGNLYGTATSYGSGGDGVVFEMTPSQGSWTEVPLYSFTNGSDGLAPQSGVIRDAAGNLYGTVPTEDNGAVYQLMPSGSGWVKNNIYTFAGGNDGSSPAGGLVADGAGNLYGTTTKTYAGGGTVFKLKRQPDGTYVESVLHNFTERGTGSYASLTMDAAGNLYGTTFSDGAYGCGSVFELVYSNDNFTFVSLHDFTCAADGAYPASDVTIDANGNLYGTTGNGGSKNQYEGYGVVWEITP